jgi:hypothetical protein
MALTQGIDAILLFSLPTYEIQDEDKYFKHCNGGDFSQVEKLRVLARG